MFTRLGKAITLAAREGGGDPDTNFKLRLAIDKARAANVPMGNIDRAIERGTGGADGFQMEEILYEGFGPGGIAVYMEALTDSRNRTVAELKHLFLKYGGNLGGPGSVGWMFERKGVIRVAADKLAGREEVFEMKAIEAGAEDIRREDDGITIMTAVSDLEKVKKALQGEAEFDSAELEYIPKETVEPDAAAKEAMEKISEELEENSDVNNYYTNLA